MRNVPRPLLVLHDDRILHEQLRAVAKHVGLEFHLLQDWEALLDAVRAAPASALVVVDPYADVEGRGGLSIELSALLNRFPSLAVTAALAVRPGQLDHVRKLGEWGVVQVIDLNEEISSILLRQRLLAARGRPLRSLLERSLPASTPGSARAILAAAASVVSTGGQGTDLARSLHITTRTLTRWCRNAGLPPPKRLLAWMRVLLAAELLDDPGRTVSDVAFSCGYAGDSSLRQAMRSFVGSTPTAIRERGAFFTAGQLFQEALVEARSTEARYRTGRTQGKTDTRRSANP